MVVETVALVLSIVTAILSGAEIFGKLWKKIKHMFGSSTALRRPFTQVLTCSQNTQNHAFEVRLAPPSKGRFCHYSSGMSS